LVQPAGRWRRLTGVRWVIALCVMVVAGCSAPEEAGRPTGAGELVLRVVDTGGLLPPGTAFRLPAFSLYGDGLLVLPGSPVVHRRLTADGVRRVVRTAVNAGLTKEQDYGYPQILDAPVTIFTLVTAKRHETAIVAPFELSGFQPAQSEARRRVHTFRQGLKDMDEWLGDDIGPVTVPEPGPQVVFSYPSSGSATAAPWPYGDLMTMGQEHGAGRCFELPADQAGALKQRQGMGTLRRSGDNVFLVTMRPMLPEEKSCADIKRAW
jgi:hypothetical protein